MNAEDYQGTSINDLTAKAGEHFIKLREECETVPDQTLPSTLDNALRPMIEHATNTEDDAEALRMVRMYVDMSHLLIVSKLPSRRRNEMLKRSNEIKHALHDYETRSSTQDTLPDRVGRLTECVHNHGRAIVEKLEAIAYELYAINTTLQPISSPQGFSAKSLALLADIDLTMTQSANLLVGSSTEKTKAVQGILDSSTNPGPDGSGQGTSSTGQAAGGAS